MRAIRILSCLGWLLVVGVCPAAWGQYFERPKKPVKPVKLDPLEKQWMQQGMRLRIKISAWSVRYGSRRPGLVKGLIKQYVALVRELKRLRFFLKQKVKIKGFLKILLQQTLQLEMRIASHQVSHKASHPKVKSLLVQRQLLRERLRQWLRMQKYKGPLYPTKSKRKSKSKRGKRATKP